MTDTKTPSPEKPSGKMFGKYSIRRELGRGGMGVVYHALDTELNRDVALKLLLARPHADPAQAEQERQRFAREAQMAARIKHPGIVTLFEAGEIQGKRYLALELIKGKPFTEVMQRDDLSLQDKVGVLKEIALAVNHAHEEGILHRDLKPANVLVDDSLSPFVMDFGLAKAMGADTGLSLTGEGLVVGTPAYMSPEQARGLKTVDGRTDVYSLGVILYEILSGRRPFEGETAIEILMKASKERPESPSSVSRIAPDPALNAVIENICFKALEKDPARRYASAKALADDLDRWLKGERVNVSSVRTRRRLAARKASPNRIWITAGSAAVLLLATLALLSWKSPGAPALEEDLAQARRHLKEGRYTEARLVFAKVLAKDPGNAQALNGDRQAETQARERRAQEEESRRRAADERLRAAQAETEKAAREADLLRQEAETRLKAAAAGDPKDDEQRRLLAELEASRERARKAEAEASRAREELERASAAKPAAAPAETAPAPPPPPPRPSPRPAVPPPSVPAALGPAEIEAKLAALLRDRDLALARFEIARAFDAVDGRAALAPEAVKAVAEKADLLRNAKKLVKTKEDATTLAGSHLRLAEEAVQADDLKAAEKAAADAVSIGRQAGEATIVDSAAGLQKEIGALKPLLDRHVRGLKTLETKPDDAGACADVGRWLCLVKGRWEEGLPHLAKGADAGLRKLAESESSRPRDPLALADAWWALAQKERQDPLKSRLYGRALACYEEALTVAGRLDQPRIQRRIDEAVALSKADTRIVFLPDASMKPYPSGYAAGTFASQKGDDPVGPFRDEPVYFDQRTGKDVVYDVRSGRRFRKLHWKGAAMQGMTIEIQDPGGSVIAKGGPWGGGNVRAEFDLEFPPLSRFRIRLTNQVSTWYLVESITLQ
jgi:serine/threonine protein kinase